jgi:hypothetical protein
MLNVAVRHSYVRRVRMAALAARVERALRQEAEEECGRMFDALDPITRAEARLGMASCLAAADALAQLDDLPQLSLPL